MSVVREPIEDRAVTIALLTKNAGPLLERSLRAIQSQDYVGEVHVLAVDSGSTDDTIDRLDDIGARVISIPSEEFNFGTTRDLAYDNASGGVVVNLSQDAVPAHEYWLRNLLAPLEDQSVVVSCGASRPDPDRNVAQFPWERNGYFYFTREMQRYRRAYGRGLSFANSAVRRSVWQCYRFDATPLGEDFQFQQKILAEGLQIAFPEGAEVLHHHNYTLTELYRRCRLEGHALSTMGFGYSAGDLCADIASGAKYVQWLRELRRGSLTTLAAALFPVVRPLAVYHGSRDARQF